jgi:hypothetical protein
MNYFLTVLLAALAVYLLFDIIRRIELLKLDSNQHAKMLAFEVSLVKEQEAYIVKKFENWQGFHAALAGDANEIPTSDDATYSKKQLTDALDMAGFDAIEQERLLQVLDGSSKQS